MNEISNTTAPPVPASAEQSAFVSGLLARQDEVLEELADLELRIDSVIEAISRERDAELDGNDTILTTDGAELAEPVDLPSFKLENSALKAA